MAILVITRPAPAAARFHEAVKTAIRGPVEVILSPILRLDPLTAPPLKEVPKGVIFTSVHGVENARQFALPEGTPAYCVGDQTAKIAAEAGYSAISAQGDSSALIDTILAQNPEPPLVHLRGETTRGDVAARLTEAGISTDERIVYRQVTLPLSTELVEAASGAVPLVLPLFSPATAAAVGSLVNSAAPLYIVVMSAAVARSLPPEMARSVRFAERSDMASMVSATAELLQDLTNRTENSDGK